MVILLSPVTCHCFQMVGSKMSHGHLLFNRFSGNTVGTIFRHPIYHLRIKRDKVIESVFFDGSYVE